MGVNERDSLDGQGNIALLLPMASSDTLSILTLMSWLCGYCLLANITWFYGFKELERYNTHYCTLTVSICSSRGKVEDFIASSCFSFSDIHKEKVSNPAPN